MSLICDLYSDGSVFFRHPNDSALATRVPMNIPQAFLYDAEERGFYVGSKASDIIHDQQFYLNTAALLDSAHKPLQGRNQAGFVEQRRVEQVRYSSQVLDDSVADECAFVQYFLKAVIRALRQSLYSSEIRP